MFQLHPIDIPGCFELQPRVVDDERGRFVKVFHADAFAQSGLETDFREEYYSHSRRGVVRGMHFQVPPSDHVKLVYCVHGEVQDVMLDLRVGSPAYGRFAAVSLSAARGNAVYLPKGVAHGFCATSDLATLVYKVSTVYDPQRDQGVLWSSFGFRWATSAPILSARDASFAPLDAFESPFRHD